MGKFTVDEKGNLVPKKGCTTANNAIPGAEGIGDMISGLNPIYLVFLALLAFLFISDSFDGVGMIAVVLVAYLAYQLFASYQASNGPSNRSVNTLGTVREDHVREMERQQERQNMMLGIGAASFLAASHARRGR
uniref:Uncharacterized protein n=1 Tax=Grammatophora oceanica TaxID=210454 RepID=A0A7S1Y5P6_9STRA|mmetsp:Transcript_28533/g.42002  ORF Transcript_28533/g.42002 Transcript_28533/m.42002 type:complete len:134 (+) Transcript_28533:109-510(+)